MAKGPVIPTAALPSLTPKDAKNRLSQVAKLGRSLLVPPVVDSAKFSTWCNIARDAIVRAFGSSSDHVSTFTHAGRYSIHSIDADFNQLRREELEAKASIVETLIEAIDVQFGRPAGHAEEPMNGPPAPATNEVFVVHGHDDAAKNAAAQCIKRYGLVPIILHEQPNKGQTIIEKLIRHANAASFAVVLLTPDDVGAAETATASNPRARQNVVLEMGIFIGKIGRERVCSLYKPGVELPSDMQGVIFTEMDGGGAWQSKLGQELAAAGFHIDLNRLIKR
jgi:predicted nucleotide-binding protein